jgi:hypothetical protein
MLKNSLSKRRNSSWTDPRDTLTGLHRLCWQHLTDISRPRKVSECLRSQHGNRITIRPRFCLRKIVDELTILKPDRSTLRGLTIRIKARTKFSRTLVKLHCLAELFAERRNRRQPYYSRQAISQATQTSSFVECSGRATFSLARPTTSGGKSRGLNPPVCRFKHGKTGLANVE